MIEFAAHLVAFAIINSLRAAGLLLLLISHFKEARSR